jgi:FkbM family methyltransferase
MSRLSSWIRRYRNKSDPIAGDVRRDSIFFLPSRDCQVRGLDGLLQAAFANKTDGVFIEVGAFDGQSYSNTCFLADLGWRGVYIEPVPAHVDMCRKRHARNPGVTVVSAAVAPETGEVSVRIAGALSTHVADVEKAYREIGWARGAITSNTSLVKTLPLDKILKDQNIQPGFDLLVVDVEGFESEVFSSFELDRWKPKMMIVELEEFHSDFSGRKEIANKIGQLRLRICAAGYVEIYVDRINTVFRDRRSMLSFDPSKT